MPKTFCILTLACAGLLYAAEVGWYPHEGEYLRYRVNARFGEEPQTMPAGWRFGRVSAVAVDSSGLVYVFQRGEAADPILVFDKEGKFVRSWGRGLFGRRHGIRVDPEDNVWVTDYGDHQVMKFTKEGRLLLTLGVKGEPAEDERHFNRPADIGFAPTGEIYIADGYGNSRIVKFSADGKYLGSWGRRGKGPGEFHTVHTVAVDSEGTVYVGDRSNNRVQIFDADGKFLRQWTHLGAPQCIRFQANDEMWVLAARNHIENQAYGGLSGRIMKVDRKTGKILGSLESPGHWLDVTEGSEIFVASMTGNVFHWFPGWMREVPGGRLAPTP